MQLANGDVVARRTWPCWGMDVKCGKGTDLSYGPWADRQRFVKLPRSVTRTVYIILLICPVARWYICESPVLNVTYQVSCSDRRL